MSTKFLRIACVLLASVAFLNCSDTSSGGGGDLPVTAVPDEIGKTNDGHDVRIFQEGALNGILTRVDTTAITDTSFNGTVIFNNMKPSDIPKVGDIIASAAAEKAPYGFLYKVLGVSTTDGVTAVVVRNASLEEAIKNVDFKGEAEFDFDEDDNLVGVRQKISPVGLTIGTDTVFFLSSLSMKGELALEYKKFTGSISAEVKKRAQLNFYIKIKDWELKGLKMSVSYYDEYTLEGKVGGKIASFDTLHTLLKKPLPTTTFLVGNVLPVVIYNELEVGIKVTASAEATLSFKYTLKGTSENGFKYENGQWLTIENPPLSPIYEVEQCFGGNARIGILVGVKALAWGLGGFAFRVGPALDINVNATPIGVSFYDEGFSAATSVGASVHLGIYTEIKPSMINFFGKIVKPDPSLGVGTFIALGSDISSSLPWFSNPKVSKTATGIMVESEITRKPLNYPVSEFGYCVEKSVGECKNGNGNRKTITESVDAGEKRAFDFNFTGLEEGTTYRIIPYFKNGQGGTFYDKATIYNPSSSSSSDPSSSSASAPCGTGLDGVWTADGVDVTISGSTGVVSAMPYEDDYFKVGDQIYKGLTSTGNLTWSGLEHMWEEMRNGALKWYWSDIRLTMSADGQTLTIVSLDPEFSGFTITFTRKCNDQSGGTLAGPLPKAANVAPSGHLFKRIIRTSIP